MTMFEMVIAMAASSALTKKCRCGMAGVVFGLAGCVFLALGALQD